MIIEVRLCGNVKLNKLKVKGNVSTVSQKITGNIKLGGIEEYYSGPVEFIPSQEEQVISVKGKTGKEDIVIKPIPSNYGKIEWDGSYLYIS